MDETPKHTMDNILDLLNTVPVDTQTHIFTLELNFDDYHDLTDDDGELISENIEKMFVKNIDFIKQLYPNVTKIILKGYTNDDLLLILSQNFSLTSLEIQKSGNVYFPTLELNDLEELDITCGELDFGENLFENLEILMIRINSEQHINLTTLFFNYSFDNLSMLDIRTNGEIIISTELPEYLTIVTLKSHIISNYQNLFSFPQLESITLVTLPNIIIPDIFYSSALNLNELTIITNGSITLPETVNYLTKLKKLELRGKKINFSELLGTQFIRNLETLDLTNEISKPPKSYKHSSIDASQPMDRDTRVKKLNKVFFDKDTPIRKKQYIAENLNNLLRGIRETSLGESLARKTRRSIRRSLLTQTTGGKKSFKLRKSLKLQKLLRGTR